jgi:uncharacterized protein
VNLLFINAQSQVRSGWKVVLFFLSYGFLSLVLSVPSYLILEMLKIRATSQTELTFSFLGASAALAVSLLAVRIEGRSFKSLGFAWEGSRVRELGLGTLLGGLLITLTAVLLRIQGGFHWVSDPTGNLKGILFGFLLFLVVGVHEETVFRGYPFQRLVESIGVWPTQVMLGLLFAAIHQGNPGISTANLALKLVTVLNLFLAAVFFGQCYLCTRNLALPIGVHLGWNWFQSSILGFGVSGTTMARGFWKPLLHHGPDWLTGEAVGLEGSVFCALILALGITGLALWKPQRTSRGQPTEETPPVSLVPEALSAVIPAPPTKTESNKSGEVSILGSQIEDQNAKRDTDDVA